MNLKTIFSCLAFLFIGTLIYGQSAVEALRYSELKSGGTARTIGIGGAISALGADFASLSTNPAGVAAYRKSEFIFTPSFLNVQTKSSLNGEDPIKEGKSNFNIENIGVIINKRPVGRPKLKSVNIGIGYNRLASFHRTTYYKGEDRGSIIESFVDLSQDLKSPDELFDFDTGLAYDVFATDFDSTAGEWFAYDDFSQGSIEREETVSFKGGINEVVLSVGANINDKLLIGGTLGLPMVNFEENREYKETDPSNNISTFDEIRFTESLSTSGFGINIKAGIIYRLTQKIRFGLAIQSPTAIALTDNFSAGMEYSFIDNGLMEREANSPDGVFDYSIITPWRASGGVAVVINRLGFLSAEFEYLDYGSSKFNITGEDESTSVQIQETILNREIEESFQSVLNVKLGAEIALNEWRFRGGYALNPTAFNDDSEIDDLLSLGLGYRASNYYLDLAYRATLSEQGYLPYNVDTAPQPSVVSEIRQNKFILTFGYRF